MGKIKKKHRTSSIFLSTPSYSLPNGCSRAFIQALASLSDDLHEDHLEQGSDRHGLLLSSNGRDYAGTDVLYAVQIHLEVFKELDFGQVLSGRLRQPPCLVAKSNKYISFVQKNARRLFLALRVMVIQCKRADVLSVVRKPLPSVGPARSVVPDVYRNHRVSFCRRARSVAAEGFPALAFVDFVPDDDRWILFTERQRAKT